MPTIKFLQLISMQLGKCQKLKPTIIEIAEKNPDLIILDIDVD